MLYELQQVVIELFNNYSSIVSEANQKVKHGEGLKILGPQQILQRLLIVLAQVKPNNTSENLLNEIRQIIYSLYWAKEITKKVYNNIMNSVNYKTDWMLYFWILRTVNIWSSQTITESFGWNKLKNKW